MQASRPSGMHTLRSLHKGLSQGCDPLPVYGKIILLRLLKGEYNHENKQKIPYYFNTFNTLHSFIAYSLRRNGCCRHGQNQWVSDGNRHSIRRQLQHFTGWSVSAGEPDFCRSWGCMEQGIRHDEQKRCWSQQKLCWLSGWYRRSKQGLLYRGWIENTYGWYWSHTENRRTDSRTGTGNYHRR